jgi:hypothetical protein
MSVADRVPLAAVERLASQMPDVVQQGGIFDDDVWYPVLERTGIEREHTKVFRVGNDDLVLVDDQWLIRPVGRERWRAREWMAAGDEYLDAAVADEAVYPELGNIAKGTEQAVTEGTLSPSQAEAIGRAARSVIPDLAKQVGRAALNELVDTFMRKHGL